MKYVFKNKKTGNIIGETDFFIGDKVYITDVEFIYNWYVNAYICLGLDFNKHKYLANRGLNIYTVKNFIKHERTDMLLVAIENEENCHVVDVHCLKKIKNVFDFSNNLEETVTFDVETVNNKGNILSCHYNALK